MWGGQTPEEGRDGGENDGRGKGLNDRGQDTRQKSDEK